MSKHNQENEIHNPNQTDLGSFFYPVGFLIAAFPKKGDAQKVQNELIASGHSAADCVLHTSKEIADASQRNLDENTGFLERLGWSYDAVQMHLEAAKHGDVFLFIYAPGDADVERAMSVIRSVPFEFVHRYHRLMIEELK